MAPAVREGPRTVVGRNSPADEPVGLLALVCDPRLADPISKPLSELYARSIAAGLKPDWRFALFLAGDPTRIPMPLAELDNFGFYPPLVDCGQVDPEEIVSRLNEVLPSQVSVLQNDGVSVAQTIVVVMIAGRWTATDLPDELGSVSPLEFIVIAGSGSSEIVGGTVFSADQFSYPGLQDGYSAAIDIVGACLVSRLVHAGTPGLLSLLLARSAIRPE